MAEDEVLAGGMANPGAVVRRGESVFRPAWAAHEALHRFLLGLREAGFSGAPVPTGPVVDGVEQLEFLAGEVPIDDTYGWIDDEPVLRSVGALLRAFHDGAARVPVDPAAPWSPELADPEGGTLLCHNDVCHSNVVFRDGEAGAIIDWDFAAPGRPVWDFAMTAWYWVPMHTRLGGDDLDRPRRLRILADAYGLPADDRAGFMDVMEQAVGVCRAFVTARYERGEPPFIASVERRGGLGYWDDLEAWLRDLRPTFIAALL